MISYFLLFMKTQTTQTVFLHSNAIQRYCQLVISNSCIDLNIIVIVFNHLHESQRSCRKRRPHQGKTAVVILEHSATLEVRH